MTQLQIQTSFFWKHPSVYERLLLPFCVYTGVTAAYEALGIDTGQGIADGPLMPNAFLAHLDKVCLRGPYIKDANLRGRIISDVFQLAFQFGYLPGQPGGGLYTAPPTADAAWALLISQAPVICHFFCLLHGQLVAKNWVPEPSAQCQDFYDALYAFLDKTWPSFETQNPHLDNALASALATFTNRRLYQGVAVYL